MTLLSVNGLSVSRGQKRVLNEVSLELSHGEFVGLLGPNGAGKSTLLKAILNLIASTGDIHFENRDGRLMREIERARFVSYLPQEREVNWPVSAKNIVSLGQAYSVSSAENYRAKREALVTAAMKRMDVLHLQDRSVMALSGGEQARVLIARAMAQDTPLLLADEPSAGLDPAHQISLMRSLNGLAGEGRSVISCLHEIPLAARWCTRIIVLDRGTVIADGAPENTLTEALIEQVYGVQSYRAKTDNGLLVVPTELTKLQSDIAGDHK